MLHNGNGEMHVFSDRFSITNLCDLCASTLVTLNCLSPLRPTFQVLFPGTTNKPLNPEQLNFKSHLLAGLL